VAVEPGGPDLAALLVPYGIQPLPGTVYDREGALYGAASFPIVQDYTEHEITKGLSRIGVAFSTTRAFEVLDPMMEDPMAPGMPPQQSTNTRPLLKTGPDAWDESQPGEAAQADPGEPRGPLTVGVIYDGGMTQPDPYGMPSEPDRNATRMVVVGDADMMTDEVVQNYMIQGNAIFALNAINWLAANEKLISIPPKLDTPKFLTVSAQQRKIVWAVVVGVVPLLIAFAGAFMWWRRR